MTDRRILLSMVILGLLLTACADQPTTPVSDYLTGQVLDDRGQPVSDAVIMVEYELPPQIPALPPTAIKFAIPKPGHVRLWLTTPCTGKVLRTLIDADLDAGLATFRPHARTDANGHFYIEQDCLPFGHEVEATDETGFVTDTFTISRRVKLFVLHGEFPTASADWLEVNPTTGLNVTISLGK